MRAEAHKYTYHYKFTVIIFIWILTITMLHFSDQLPLPLSITISNNLHFLKFLTFTALLSHSTDGLAYSFTQKIEATKQKPLNFPPPTYKPTRICTHPIPLTSCSIEELPVLSKASVLSQTLQPYCGFFPPASSKPPYKHSLFTYIQFLPLLILSLPFKKFVLYFLP